MASRDCRLAAPKIHGAHLSGHDGVGHPHAHLGDLGEDHGRGKTAEGAELPPDLTARSAPGLTVILPPLSAHRPPPPDHRKPAIVRLESLPGRTGFEPIENNYDLQ